MLIEERLPLVEEILGRWKNEIGNDYEGYQNHVYRMIHFCLAQRDFDDEERKKIMIAGCFHDLGIWTHRTFDYLSPSVMLAKEYLRQNDLEDWISEIEPMIGSHHRLTKSRDESRPLVEVFRKGDLVDFSLGFVKCGLPKNYIRSVKSRFPNAGFHRRVLRTASWWFCRHPLNPLPVVKW